jgi:hypothetical protein
MTRIGIGIMIASPIVFICDSSGNGTHIEATS